MPTADEVIAALREACEYALAVTEDRQPGSYDDIMLAMRAALDLARSYRGWRSLEDERPDENQKVLVMGENGEPTIDWYNQERDSFWVSDGRLWHPLPEPPKP